MKEKNTPCVCHAGNCWCNEEMPEEEYLLLPMAATYIVENLRDRIETTMKIEVKQAIDDHLEDEATLYAERVDFDHKGEGHENDPWDDVESYDDIIDKMKNALYKHISTEVEDLGGGCGERELFLPAWYIVENLRDRIETTMKIEVKQAIDDHLYFEATKYEEKVDEYYKTHIHNECWEDVESYDDVINDMEKALWKYLK